MKEAEGVHAEEWKRAMHDLLVSSKAWILVERSESKKKVRCRWVLIIKYTANGVVERRKVRLVAKR